MFAKKTVNFQFPKVLSKMENVLERGERIGNETQQRQKGRSVSQKESYEEMSDELETLYGRPKKNQRG